MSGSKIILLILWFLIFKCFISYCQNDADSLVVFSDLKFSSEFEKQAFINFVGYKKDTFLLFMAIDKKMTEQQARTFYQGFQSIFVLLHQKKLDKTESKNNITKIFKLVHDKLLYNYRTISHFPSIFTSGTYNCVSASILYALIFKQLQIPYKIFQTPNHVYLVALPGEESMIIETTNPNLKEGYFTRDFKEDYVQKLKSVKMVAEDEKLNKSIDEIFNENYYKGVQAEFQNLFGFEYLNEGLYKIRDNQSDQTYEILQKAYFFFPDRQIKQVLYNALIQKIENCKFEKLSDIDYLVQLSRFECVDNDKLIKIFLEIIKNPLQYTDKVQFCDSLFQYFVQKIPDKTAINEISFDYYLFMSRHFRNSDRMINYIEKAIALKQNHVEANNLFIEQIEKRLDLISGFNIINDSINFLEKKYNYSFVKQLFADYRLIAFLNQAYNFYSYNKITEGNYYLRQFEDICPFPINLDRKKLVRSIEITYRSLAIYYFYKGDKYNAQKTIDHCLKFVPASRYIQTAVY
jgi:hypothetical protein